MSHPEGPDGSSSHERGITQAVLRTAILRHNDLMKRKYGSDSTEEQVVIGAKTEFRLSTFLDSFHMNRGLRIAVIEPNKNTPPSGDVNTPTQGLAHSIELANYDAGKRKFLPYPELMSADEFAVVAEEAREARSRGVETSEYDFDHPDIVKIHKAHRKVLEEGGLIAQLVRSHKELDFAKGRDVHIDTATSYHVSLQSDLSEPSSDVPVIDDQSMFRREGSLLVVELIGDYEVVDGIPERIKSDHIVIGVRNEDSVEERYTPIEVGRAILPEQFEKLVGLAKALNLTKMVHLNLDTQAVALIRNYVAEPGVEPGL